MCPSKSPILVTLAFDPEEMARRGRVGGRVTHARHDSRALTEPARAAFDRKFLVEVDPDRTLPESERERRAREARRLYFARLGRLSALARKEAANVVA